ncbi:methyltransferase domain-containing protein [Actinoplanes sp. NPDC049596]|uniref:class I SAM-dependent methyltransferase n=1 Tax=unclassified Actinoplanes TaxID=2626549 RepID=UPI0034369776
MSLLSEFLRRPWEVGAVAPSGAALSELAVAPIPSTGDPVVVELGPGTGPFTEAIQRRLDGRGRHLAIEINPRLAEQLAARHPNVEVITADAGALPGLLAERGLAGADVIVSGLPWAAFAPDRQRDILAAAVQALAPGGAFTTFAYVHLRWAAPARRLRGALDSWFDEVLLGRTVWANLPPALVYYCRRPALVPVTRSATPARRCRRQLAPAGA